MVGELADRGTLLDALTARGLEVGSADADLAVAAYRAFGSEFPKHLNGSFAVVVYDAQAHVLILARDPLGHWPVYYRVGREDVVFSTELQTLLEAGVVPRALDLEGAASYFRLGFIPSPRSPVQDVRALPPGSALVVDRGGTALMRHRRVDFSVQDEATSLDAQLGRAESALQARLGREPSDAEVWLEPDLPSVVLTALAGRLRGRVVQTVAPIDDEASARFAHLLGTEHRTAEVAPGLDDLVRMVGALDTPLADPAWLVREALARSSDRPAVTAAGAGPVFATNPRYPDALTADAIRRSLPAFLERVAPDFGRSVESIVRRPDVAATRRGLTEDFARAVDGLQGPELDEDADPLAQLQAADLRYGTSDALLTGLTTWSAWTGCRVATPYVDADLLDVTGRLPARGRLEGREVGAGLGRIARRMLPGRLVREDFGSYSPGVADWMRSGLREAAEMAFFGASGGLSGLLDSARLRRAWYAHQMGWADHGQWLFALVVFELWAQSTLGER